MKNEEFAEIDAAMSAFYDKNKHLFDKKLANTAAEYIRVGEWGLALELILFCLERRSLPLPESERNQVYALARLMDLDLEKTRANWPKKP